MFSEFVVIGRHQIDVSAPERPFRQLEGVRRLTYDACVVSVGHHPSCP
jgi:hypothetical protein